MKKHLVSLNKINERYSSKIRRVKLTSSLSNRSTYEFDNNGFLSSDLFDLEVITPVNIIIDDFMLFLPFEVDLIEIAINV